MESSYQKLIHDYLDGSLSEEEQRQLFDNLSANPEWREELNFQMRMQEAMQKDLNAVTIPVKTTASIYSALGFGVPERAAATLFSKIVATSSVGKFVAALSVLAVVPTMVYVLTSKEAPTSQPLPSPKLQLLSPAVPNTISAPEATVSEVPATDVKEAPHAAANPATRKSSLDIGKFSSVDYLTKQKVIGISSGGNIYLSDDGGTAWANLHSNTTKDLYGIHFRDSSNGVIVGASGTILLTVDAGKNWALVSSGTQANLIAVRYVSKDILFACGAQGTILLSTTGGLLWKKLESPVTASLFNIHFDNAKAGVIRGEHGIILETADGGLTWTEKTENN